MKVGSKEHLAQRGIKAWAAVPLEYLYREIALDRCADSRLRHLMILWSWCGPEPTEYVTVRDERNRLVLDGKQPIPARHQDLADKLEIIGDDGKLQKMKRANVTRLLNHLERQKGVTSEGRKMYLVYKPPAVDPKKCISTDTFSIAGIRISTEMLPTDPEARTDAIRFIAECSTRWKADLKRIKTDHRDALRLGLFERGILIEKKNLKRREESTRGGGSSVSVEERQPDAKETAPPPPPVLSNALKPYGADPEAVHRLLRDCRKIAPECTEAEICAFIETKAVRIAKGRIENPVGFLCSVIPSCFEGDYKSTLRKDGGTREITPQRAEERAAAELVTYLMDLDNPDLGEAEHEAARQKIAAARAAIADEARRLYAAMKPCVAGAAE